MVVTLQDLDRTAEASSMGMASLLASVRFAVLWLVVGCALAGSMAVFFAEPGRLEEGLAGVMEGKPVTTGDAYLLAAMAALPLVMATVVLFLTGRTSAIVNLVVGAAWGAMGVFLAVSEVSEGALPPHVALAAVGGVVAWLIVGLSVSDLRGRPRGAVSASTAEDRGAA
jgi:hypothetical protein